MNQDISIDLNGSLGSVELSLTIITFLESINRLNLPVNININLGKANFNEPDFNEILMVRSVEFNYPSQILDYLLLRASK